MFKVYISLLIFMGIIATVVGSNLIVNLTKIIIGN